MGNIRWLIVVTVMLCLGGISKLAESGEGSKGSEPPARAVPNFEVKLLDGKSVTPKSFLGSVTVIDFWGTWCKPCLMEIPDYNDFYRFYKEKGVRFVALAVESGTSEEVRAAVKRLKIEYPVAALSAEDFDKYFRDLYVFPTTWIIDAQGNIQKEFLGVSASKHKTLRETVDHLLSATK